jgi:hypothetical protein
LGTDRVERAKLTPEARVHDGRIEYPAD